MPSGYAIQTRNLRKVFGSKVAVRNLSLEVRQGEIFGFLGPNGAGKSTSIKLLLGLTHATGGEAEVLGRPAGHVAERRRIGFLPEEFRFYSWLTATELLHFHGRLCGVPAGDLRTRIPELIERVGLTPHRDKRLQHYSKGMLQRIGLAQALVHQPDLIFLDEPTSGLDPMGRRLVRDIVRAQRDRGATVFLNSHLLSEIEVTCDRVVFLRDGEVVATHDLANQNDSEVRVTVRARNLTLETLSRLAAWKPARAAAAPASTNDVPGIEHLVLTAPSREDLPEMVRCLTACGADVYEFTPTRMSLEELFVGIVGRDAGL